MKKTISILLSVIMLISVIATSTVSVSADINLNNYKSYSINSSVSSAIAENSDGDVYKFTLGSSGKINLDFTGYLEWIYINIYDVNGNQLYWSNPRWNYNTKKVTISEYVTLKSGTYYLSIAKDGERTGNYNFKLSYTVSKPGTPSVSISKGKCTFKWAKASGVSGYQLEVSSYSNFKKISVRKTQSSSKYTKTLSRKKKYYVRVRSYKKIGSSTYYSGWATKSFKTK